MLDLQSEFPPQSATTPTIIPPCQRIPKLAFCTMFRGHELPRKNGLNWDPVTYFAVVSPGCFQGFDLFDCPSGPVVRFTVSV